MFPVNKFGYNELPAREYEKRAKIKDDKKYKELVEPYPHLSFVDHMATIKGNPDVDSPWDIDMIRDTMSYKNGEIWEEGDEQREAKRVATGIPSYLTPEDFNDNHPDYLKAFKFLNHKFKGQTKEECDDFYGILEDTVKRYRIVNVALPSFNNNVPKFAKLLESKRVEIEALIEDLFD